MKNLGEKSKSPLLWTWEAQVDYKIWVQVYTKNKDTITAWVKVTQKIKEICITVGCGNLCLTTTANDVFKFQNKSRTKVHTGGNISSQSGMNTDEETYCCARN